MRLIAMDTFFPRQQMLQRSIRALLHPATIASIFYLLVNETTARAPNRKPLVQLNNKPAPVRTPV